MLEFYIVLVGLSFLISLTSIIVKYTIKFCHWVKSKACLMAAALPIPDDDDLPISIEGLKNILECPVCLSPPTSTPIYRCDNGHILCSVCRSKVKICPECRIELGNLRCLTSEKIVTAMLPKVNYFIITHQYLASAFLRR